MSIDFEHFQNFWVEQQKTAVHMDRGDALAHIVDFIKAHNTCGFATGYGDYIRCTPIEYTYMDDEFWFVSEGGNKFIGLEKNRNVSMAIFEYYGDVRDTVCRSWAPSSSTTISPTSSKSFSRSRASRTTS